MGKQNGGKKEDRVVVAIDKDKGSQYALKWAVDHLLTRGQTVTLLHIKQKSSSTLTSSGSQGALSDDEATKSSNRKVAESPAKELFLPFRCFCTRKDIKCTEIIVEDMDISRAILEFVESNVMDTLILGYPSRGGFVRFKTTDVTTSVSKGAPDFCTVYIINKGKISSVKSATAPPPLKPSPLNQMESKSSNISDVHETLSRSSQMSKGSERSYGFGFNEDAEIKSPFTRSRGSVGRPYEPSIPDTDISFVSSERLSIDHISPSFCDSESGMTPRFSNGSEYDIKSIGSPYYGNKSFDISSQHNFSSSSQDSGRLSCTSQNIEDVESEMRRLRQELKQTMELYSSACKEALTAKQKAKELHLWKLEEQQKLEEARLGEEAALQLVEKEKAKCKVAVEAAEAAQRIAELEAQKRRKAEMKAFREAEEKKKAIQSLENKDIRYRRYTIEEIEIATENFSNSLKIGEGGYGPVYKGYLDHTSVAIKVLRPDAAHGRAQFQQEVEVLSCIRHPNMVLLLGACPEYGCLVYEHMANGSLDDRLFRRGRTPPLSWQVRFRIAAEIGTGLLFLHQTKPEPLVHRDLKPGNILLDRNYVSKISDVGLARLVPPSVANSVTQYRMTSTAGTFCYIDPEYQQTGMLGTKSDIYSLGVMLLQIITGKPPMGLTHHVERAIERGTFPEILDPIVPDWPVEEALKFAKLALQCAELRRKDRPDLGKIVLPELQRLSDLAEEHMPNLMSAYNTGSSLSQSSVSTTVMAVVEKSIELSNSLVGHFIPALRLCSIRIDETYFMSR
ncbi:hypothetical protein K2173_017688 [Erythroxylum novogranatense]|uniref:RING-type E3 ubiquitin transferase n=1 Tax=Erythroxylum novogranatense TaxID=1862640 RepID=A0AAV8SM99_9ROSI|nr:hypothetical protein K2173_017688 [Erythroxylum novogranatense]